MSNPDDILAAMERDFAEERRADVRSQKLLNDPDDSKNIWKCNVRALPTEVVKLVGSIDVLSLRNQALDQIEEKLFGWSGRRIGDRTLDSERIRTTWRDATTSNRRATTLRRVRLIVDHTKHLAQIQKLQVHECASSLASWQQNPKVREGVLHTLDVGRGTLTFGVRSYPEATPVEIPVLVTQLWIKLTGKSRPACWDLTAGSGTNHDVITVVFGGKLVGTDIALDNATTFFGDLRDAGHHPRRERKARKLPGDRLPTDLITSPDLVFIHPPSRGWPACCWIYGRDREHSRDLDIGVLLERDLYVEVLAGSVRETMTRLAPGGLISVLVPEYLRLHQEVVPDAGTANALLHRLASDCALIERHQVVEQAPVRQASLGNIRGPVTHLILQKKAAL